MVQTRFALLRHDTHDGVHWDLLVERGDASALASWRLAADPTSLDPPAECAAIRIADHRPKYLDYEGEISDGRGQVARVDGGRGRVVSESVACTRLELLGDGLRGEYEINTVPGGAACFRAIQR